MATIESSLASQVLALLAVRKPAKGHGEPDELLRAAVRRGLPYSSVRAVLHELAVPQAELAAVLGIPTRTLARRQSQHHLRPDESDRLYRVARSVAMAQAVFGDPERARRWLTESNRALGGESPLALLDTEIGARQVEDVLERINYGMFS